MQIAEALQEFLLEHQARGSRPKTLRYYRYTISNLLKPYMEQDINTLNTFTLNKALNSMSERGVKPATLASADRALRGFTAWLHGVELIPKDPMKGKKRPKLRWEPKQVLSESEICSMFAVVKMDARYKERNTGILYLLLGCGLRAGEVAGLSLSDIDWEQGIIKVNGKTGYGLVPVDRKILQAIRRYITHRRKAKVNDLFVFNGRKISAATISKLISHIAKRAGIERPVGPHVLRHTFATAFIEGGGDAFSLKRILRHSTLYTSMQYVHSSTASIREKMEISSPLKSIRL